MNSEGALEALDETTNSFVVRTSATGFAVMPFDKLDTAYLVDKKWHLIFKL